MIKSSWYHKDYGGVKSPWLKIDRVRAHIREVIDWHYELIVDDTPKVTVADLMSQSRLKYLVRARADVSRRLRFDLKWSFPRIAALMQRDHTTIIHHCQPYKGASTWSDRAKWLEFIRRQEVARLRSVARDVDEFEQELKVRALMREQYLLRKQLRKQHAAEIEATYAAE